MRKFTKLFAIAVISFAAFAASAQSSKRSGATMGLFFYRSRLLYGSY